jgi:hypothetical protein
VNPDERIAHLLGREHGLPENMILPVPDSSNLERWTLASHVTHHGAPYPPAQPHTHAPEDL